MAIACCQVTSAAEQTRFKWRQNQVSLKLFDKVNDTLTGVKG